MCYQLARAEVLLGPLFYPSAARFIMIDVCQWRASIGLWYYQIICDNVMNKCLLALLRKGTKVKVKKQSSSTEHSQAPPNSNYTALVEQSISSEISQRNFNRRKRSSKLTRRKKVQSTSSQIPVALPVQSTSSQTPVPLPVQSTSSQTPVPLPVQSTSSQTPVTLPVQSTSTQISVALPAIRSVQSTNSQIPVALPAVRSVQSTSSQILSQLPIVQSNSKTSDWYSEIQIFFLVLLLLILSGDIELNPGPKAGNNYYSFIISLIVRFNINQCSSIAC